MSALSWLRKRIASFKYAFEGIATLVRQQPNARIHFVALVVVITASALVGLSNVEWCIILLCCGAVFAAEALNSAVEMLADKVSPEFSPLIKKAKDMAAAAVLMLAITAVIVAALIFGPKLFM